MADAPLREPRRYVARNWNGLQRESDELEARGFDGLFHPTAPCGCWIGDLRPCGEFQTGCIGGYTYDGEDLLIGPKR